MNITEIYSNIITGKLDSELNQIREAIRNRKEIIRDQEIALNRMSIDKGDIVKLKGLSPKYLNGLLAEVQYLKTKTAWVKLDANSCAAALNYRAWKYKGRTIGVPLSCLTKND